MSAARTPVDYPPQYRVEQEDVMILVRAYRQYRAAGNNPERSPYMQATARAHAAGLRHAIRVITGKNVAVRGTFPE